MDNAGFHLNLDAMWVVKKFKLFLHYLSFSNGISHVIFLGATYDSLSMALSSQSTC